MRSRALLLAPAGAVAVAVGVYFASLADDSLSRLHQQGVIRIGYAVEPPYAYLKAGGEVTGESPELARRVVARLGIPRIEWRQAEFGELFHELEAGRVDVIAAGMFVTATRAQRVGFSAATFHVHPALLVAEGNPRRVDFRGREIRREDIRIAVLAGAVEGELLRRMGFPASQILLVPDALTGHRAIESGVADGLMLSAPSLRWMASREHPGGTEVVELRSEPESVGIDGYGNGAFAFRPADEKLREAWNEAMCPYLGSAEHRRLVGRFGFAEAELPPIQSAGPCR
jgi:polar amino acid transport system substrate-binding protein